MHRQGAIKYKFTDFEKAVYKVVSRIPIGEVRSYKWVAEKIGRPNAVRAVGTALKNNPFAPIVPCHRVIKNDGTLGGYSCGLRKKRELLSLEQKILRRVVLERNKIKQVK